MNVVVAHGEGKPGPQVAKRQGIWLADILLAGLPHVALLSIPFFSISVVLTLTHVIITVYVFLHTMKGTPLETPDQGMALLLSR
ncbi:hypothetical protein GH733_006553 [Mirounga leonina]|nr:hypothetical protein GH733_006553 [Mirounga leonina]